MSTNNNVMEKISKEQLTLQDALKLMTSIKKFDASNLSKTQTVVTTENGKRYRENNDGRVIERLNDQMYGEFIIDARPDSELAQLTPYLYIGSLEGAYNLNSMRESGVTHILNLSNWTKTPFSNEFIYKTIEMLDIPETDIRSKFQECFDFIDNARRDKHNAKVLVHCMAGVSRSATICIAYIMSDQAITLKDAYELVKTKRDRIKPNYGFYRALEKYESDLGLSIHKSVFIPKP